MSKLRILILVLVAMLLAACGQGGLLEDDDTPTPAPSAIPSNVPPTATATPFTRPSTINCNALTGGFLSNKLPKIAIADLYRCRPEVKPIVSAIKANGPFPYSRDNIVFQNREGILPSATTGNGYREYTVVTPGSNDRGTRRIITYGTTNRLPGSYTKLYYTDDHYTSFWIVTEP